MQFISPFYLTRIVCEARGADCIERLFLIKKYIYLTAIITCFNCCVEDKRLRTDDDTILFRTSQAGLVFQLKVDDDFYYYDSLESKDVVFGYPIGRIKKKKDISTIRLRRAERADSNPGDRDSKSKIMVTGLKGSKTLI